MTGKNLKTWIFTIARHVAIDPYRKRRFASV
nr:sigma factor [Oceanobacillus bengalensis]